MAKQDRYWRAVAAAIAACDEDDARVALAPLVTPTTDPVIELALRLVGSRRADERRVGALLVVEILAARPDHPRAVELGDAGDH